MILSGEHMYYLPKGRIELFIYLFFCDRTINELHIENTYFVCIVYGTHFLTFL